MQIRSRRLSRLRQTLARLKSRPGKLLPAFMQGHAMVRGTVYTLKRRCGKATCRCARGNLHETVVLSASISGRPRIWTIPPERIEELRILTKRYRRFRSARADFVKLYKKMLRAIDGIEEILRREP